MGIHKIKEALRWSGGVDLFTNTTGNNFDLVRLIASFMVIYGHSFAISPKDGHYDIMAISVGGGAYSGSVAVAVFFFLSGALVTRSMVESSTPLSFAKKRVARIWPALAVCVLVTALVFAPLFGGGTIDKGQLLTYVLRNVSNIVNQHSVSGVYDHHPNTSLNGSLWSLTLEARLYFVWFIAMLVGLHRRRPLLLLFLASVTGLLIFAPSHLLLLGSNPALAGSPAFPFHALLFVAGALFFLGRGGRINHFYIFCGALLILKMLPGTYVQIQTVALWAAIIALSLVIARLPLLHKIKLPGDYSYGVYLYGWPAQQVTYACAPNLSPEFNFLVAACIAASAAAISWHFLEKPVLDKVRGKRAAPVSPMETMNIEARA